MQIYSLQNFFFLSRGASQPPDYTSPAACRVRSRIFLARKYAKSHLSGKEKAFGIFFSTLSSPVGRLRHCYVYLKERGSGIYFWAFGLSKTSQSNQGSEYTEPNSSPNVGYGFRVVFSSANAEEGCQSFMEFKAFRALTSRGREN